MTPREQAVSLLVEDGFEPDMAEAWVDDPGHRATIVRVCRSRRAGALCVSRWAETERSERAGIMARALLAVVGSEA